jgi:TonB-dependent receptor
LLLFLVGFTFVWAEPLYSQGTSTITGRVLDAGDSSPLWGVNVTIKNTSLGASTNDEGRFTISNIAPGTYTLVFSYLGYTKLEQDVVASPSSSANVDVSLSQSMIAGQEVVVTGQLRGQQAAINQQLNSNAIVNVLSQERIRDLPDQNAAEAISRLPGISVQRDGGEAQKVIIQGLPPQYANITINGEKIPSTDLSDRSVDLSSISSDMLAGIEVYKSPTADKDGDAIAGTVNFAMRKAPDAPSTDLRFEGGYNALEQDYGDYKGSINLSNRFLDDALGVVLTGSIQRANRGSDGQQESYSLSYEPTPGSTIPYKIDDMRLVDIREIRKRYGASIATDFDLDADNSFLLTGFWSKTDRDGARRRERYNIQEARLEYDYLDHVIGTQLYSLGLNGSHHLLLPVIGVLNVDWRAANSQSDQNNPGELYARFFQPGLPGVIADQGPDNVPPSVTPDPNNTWLYGMTFTDEEVIDRDYTFQIDAKSNFSWGTSVSGYLKFGAKVATKSREHHLSQIQSNTAIQTDLGPAIYNNPGAFYRSFPLTTDVNHKVLLGGFLTADDQIGEFLSGKYPTWSSISGSSIHDFWNNMRYWVGPRGIAIFDNNLTSLEDQIAAGESYSADETTSAGYVMAEIDLGTNFMILPGIRYERTNNDYRTLFGNTLSTTDDTPTIVNLHDSTGTGTHVEWLPMVQMRVDVAEGMSLRASVARTLARPNFFDLVPYENINRTGSPRTIDKGNPSLKYTTALNYDLYYSAFNNYGLFTIGAFYKTLDNVSYIRTSYILSGKYSGFELIQPVNAEDPSTVYGMEIDVQANLTLLPSPFDGIIVSGNLSLMKSRTLYPRFQVSNTIIPAPPFVVVSVLDTVREAPMPGQADKMGNFTIGYEKGGFSGRISFVFQGRSLAVVGTRAETDGYTDPYYRWDLAVQQKVIAGVSLFLNVNNITAVEDLSSNQRFITSENYYGRSAQLGIRYRF